ncbi:MAG: Peptidoglycan glycosyltransferase [Berkelbacteria bacterium GW2011_GWA1_36_9]|uniref:Peptidoglycan glycosyltransferase n=1 Tax=Berkelbacteria bacterium GW2011_GWA1_36_9 TaxID=1618331 RepID=A0A0G0I2Y8_9BACT|nr:MAG: Peptidoglycan glycosyltransferase [Berkelbacteria bacterium GW2011_GWA1_36_9]
MVVFGAAIISRLFFVQIINHKLYQAQALGQQAGFASVTGARGQIFSQSNQQTKGTKGSGETKNLAINKDSWTISANPNDIPDKPAFAKVLSGYINQTEDQLLSEINTQDSYIVLKKDLTSDELDKIKALNLDGLYWQNNPVRFYSQGDFAGQVLGFLGGEGSGQYGLEDYYEDILKGKSGIKEKKKGLGSIFSDNNKMSLDGSDIYLTIDYNIQFQAESLLKKQEEKNDIDSGQIIVLKPDSGRILALANFPSFNPNQYSKEKDLDVFQNGAVQKLFEPGSILKPFTMAIALNEGKITPDTTYVDTGFVKFGLKTIHNFANEVYGEQTMTQVLENSINTGAVFASQQISHKTYLDYIDKFGFTQKTGVDLQGEVYSNNDVLRAGSDMNFATASFGQGIELTPMQIVRGFAMLANGGKIVKPYIVEKIVNGQDEIIIKPKTSDPVVSQKTISDLTKMLINVVDNGFNGVAKIPGYYLAGKTGTAQVPLKNGKGYEPDKTIQSFVGYGPAYNPQFLILVKLDNPKVPQSSLSAVPVFKELAQYIINYWQIPPDYDASKK